MAGPEAHLDASGESGYLPRRCQRVRFSIFLCFFLRMRLRRFLISDPMASQTIADGIRSEFTAGSRTCLKGAGRSPRPGDRFVARLRVVGRLESTHLRTCGLRTESFPVVREVLARGAERSGRGQNRRTVVPDHSDGPRGERRDGIAGPVHRRIGEGHRPEVGERDTLCRRPPRVFRRSIPPRTLTVPENVIDVE